MKKKKKKKKYPGSSLRKNSTGPGRKKNDRAEENNVVSPKLSETSRITSSTGEKWVERKEGGRERRVP